LKDAKAELRADIGAAVRVLLRERIKPRYDQGR
jgi:hypothetical protein